MKITDPVLVPDVSSWCDHIKTKEFEDGGCQSVIVGLYPIMQGGKQVLSPISRAQAQAVANSSMVLQAYFWDDIILDPIRQADWLVDTITMEGLPVKFVWADQEQWWGNWKAHDDWQQGKAPFANIPIPSPSNISIHNCNFATHLRSRFPQCGVYTNKGFVASWAGPMDNWLQQFPAWPAQYGRQPNIATKMTWAELQANWMPNYDIILSRGQLPENVKGHQFTADCILPGSYNQYDGKIPLYDGRLPLDVSVFSKAFIDGLRGGTLPAPVPPHPAICPTCGQNWPQK